MAQQSIEASRRAEWERIRQEGVWPWAIRRGLARGIPMGLLILVALELVQGHPLNVATFRDPGLWARLALAIALFSVGGAASAYARWRALDVRFNPARAED